MVNEGEPSQPRNISLVQAHKMRGDKVIIDLQEPVRKLAMELERVKRFERRGPHCQELDVNPINITYSSSHENCDDRGVIGRKHLRDDLSDLKIEASKFDYNPKLKNYLG